MRTPTKGCSPHTALNWLHMVILSPNVVDIKPVINIWLVVRLSPMADPMLNRTSIMIAAWASYRKVAIAARYERSCRRLFGRILRQAWINAKAEAARQRRAASVIVLPVTPAEPTAFDTAMDALKYLPAHMSFERAAAAVRTRFAAYA
ncbi:hypothetical protein [Aureimonas leprariae]|uniref:hypothetical protein n=1 Tax=Plantimonas leprariae TaxID=2615207 RepID=UPI001AED593E|nr:hypothetical protein [Aureimonas leprariae]